METKYLIEAIGWILLMGLFAYGIYFLLDKWNKWRELRFIKKVILIFVATEILFVLVFLLPFVYQIITECADKYCDIAYAMAGLFMLFVAVQIYGVIFALIFLLYHKLNNNLLRIIILFILLIISLSCVIQNFDVNNLEILKCQTKYSFSFSRIISLPAYLTALSGRDYYCYAKVSRETLDMDLCEKLPYRGPDGLNRNDCYKYIAINKNEASLCEKIEYPDLYELEIFVEDDCYKEIAIKTNNLELCDKINNDYFRNDCRMELLGDRYEFESDLNYDYSEDQKDSDYIKEECTDSDGKDYYTKGFCQDNYTNEKIYDTCLNDINNMPKNVYLREIDCFDTTYGFRCSGYNPYKCPNGCRDGACIK